MDVKSQFSEWIEKKRVYQKKPYKTFIDKFVSFLGFNPFELKDDYSDIFDIIDKIEIRKKDLNNDELYLKFNASSQNGVPSAIFGPNNYYTFLEDIYFNNTLEVLKDSLISDEKTKGLFTFPKNKGNDWVWIGDRDGFIGTEVCHYEIAFIKKTKTYTVNVHFEGSSESQELFKTLLQKLPTELETYKWRIIPSVKYGNGIHISNSNLVIELKEQLYFIESKIGDQLREIICSSKISPDSFKMNMKQPFNQILFGPPGTGKTYNTINEALKIVDPEFYAANKENRDSLTKRYKELLISDWNSTSGQIAFCTFHQSFSYEDFVEGIKPNLSVEDGSTLRYEIESGIFKKICDLADSKKGNYDEIIEKFKQEISEFEGKEPIKIVANSTFDVTYKGGNVFYVSPLNSKKDNPWYPVSLNHIKKYFETGDLAGTYNTTYVKGICNFLLEKRGLTKSVNGEAASKDFVLIIDEINRGNVSSIFGELITLIEDDKRIDANEELQVVLPYTKEPFGVPKNVHIIGTMNTADRSVEALDTALRRRFTFKEMPPQSELISRSILLKGVDGQPYEVNLKEMLDTINSRIERLIDKDHKIGHSYFINVQSEDDLKEAFRNKVIPLLEEYFFGDFGKIGLVLGDSFVEKVNGGFEFAAFSGYDPNVAQDLKVRCVYAIKDSSQWNFRSIYTPNKAQ